MRKDDSTTRYDWGTQCTVRNSAGVSQSMHCCPTGYAMVGLKASSIVAVPLEEAGSRQRAPDLDYYRMARMLAK